MNIKKLTIVCSIIAGIIGIIIGVFVKNFPIFTLDSSIKITEAIDTLVTIFIGIAIPVIAKHYFDKLDSDSNFLAEEIKVFEQRTNNVKCLIDKIYQQNVINTVDKESIITEFDLYDIDYNQLGVCIAEFKKNQKLQNEYKEFCNKYFQLWKLATGMKIISTAVEKIDSDTYKKINSYITQLNAHSRKLRIRFKD